MWEGLVSANAIVRAPKVPRVAANGLYRKVLAHIADNPGTKARDIRLALEVPALNLQWALRGLEASGYVQSKTLPVADRRDGEPEQAKHFWTTQC